MATGFGAVGIGATLAGGLLSAYGANKQGESTQKMYNYQSQVAKINADINRQNAAWSLQKGEREAVQVGMKGAQQRGQIVATQAASGLDVNTGSQRRVQESQGKITQMDQAQLRENAAKVAYDYETKATMDESQADMYTMAGEQARDAGRIKGLESILGTASTVSSKWQHGRTTGLW